MSDNQQPKPYDAILGGQNQPPEGAAVLGGIEGVKIRIGKVTVLGWRSHSRCTCTFKF
ncbi:MAG: hypothetical protein WBA41_20095 [Rivularia sp. (in: cyanobacteria)]